MWEANLCCCGGTGCCALTSVTWSATAGNMRFDGVDGNGVFQLEKIRTCASTTPTNGAGQLVNGAVATIGLRPAFMAGRVLTRLSVSGNGVPSCIYKSAVIPTSGTGFHGGSFVRRVDAIDSSSGQLFSGYFTGTMISAIYVAQSWGFGATGGKCWEAGLIGTIRFNPPAFVSGLAPINMLIRIAARAGINQSNCPTNLVYQTGDFSPSTYWAGCIHTTTQPSWDDLANARIGNTTQTAIPLSRLQYSILPESGLLVSIQ